MDESEKMVFRGYDCCEKFVEWIFNCKPSKYVSRIFIAHNLGSYDGFLILKELYRLKNPPGEPHILFYENR